MSAVIHPRVLLVYRRHASTFVYYPAMLSRAGFRVDVLTVPGHPVHRSVHVTGKFTAPNDDTAFQAAMAQRLASTAYVAQLFIDEAARRLGYALPPDAGRDALLPIPRANPLSEAVDDKLRFQAWCEQHSLPVARTYIADHVEAAAKHAETLGYPVVVKCSVGVGGQAVRICSDEAALREAFTTLAMGGPVMVQEFISGPVGSLCFAAVNGNLGAWIASEKKVALLGGLGPGVVRHTRADSVLGDIAIRIAAAGQITGITGCDWMEKSPGCFVIIDPHCGRCTPPAVLGTYSDVDLGIAFRRLFDGDNRVDPPVGWGDRVAMFPQIVELIFEGRLGQLWRAAPAFSKRTHYFFGPTDEWRLSLALGLNYFVSGFRVLLGGLRNRLKHAANVAPERPFLTT